MVHSKHPWPLISCFFIHPKKGKSRLVFIQTSYFQTAFSGAQVQFLLRFRFLAEVFFSFHVSKRVDFSPMFFHGCRQKVCLKPPPWKCIYPSETERMSPLKIGEHFKKGTSLKSRLPFPSFLSPLRNDHISHQTGNLENDQLKHTLVVGICDRSNLEGSLR